MKSKSWYKKRMPQVKEVKNDLNQLVDNLISINGVDRIYAWGQLAENYNKEKANIKEIDIVLKTSFFSEDLISINDAEDSPLHMSLENLEDYGYDLNTVNFTKNIIAKKNNPFHFKKWVISSDEKILHWGGIPESVEEWYEIKKEAEEYAEISTGSSKEKIKTQSINLQNKWAVVYDHTVNKYLTDMPKGWYPYNCKLKEVKDQLIELKEK